MRTRIKLVATALVLTLGLVPLSGILSVQATVGSFNSSPTSFPSNSSAALTLTGTDDGGGGGVITVTASGGTTPVLAAISCTVQDPVTFVPVACIAGAPLTTGSVISLLSSAFDGNSSPEQFTVQLTITASCSANTTVNITAAQDNNSDGDTADPGESISVNSGSGVLCTAGSTAGSGVGIVSVTASPNALICGGTSTITAYTRDTTTGALVPGVFHFTTGTTGTDSLHQGQLIQQTDNTAILALLPGHVTTTVTASTVGIIPGGKTTTINGVTVPVPEVISGTVVVQNYCGEQATEPIAVVAAPNVIACGGTAKITATARDLSGIIIPGTGFTFTTDYGVLIVGPPNTAASTSGTATLTLQPGMGAEDPSGTSPGIRFATVTAQLGAKVGTVKVQQFCPGVTTDSSTAPGRIALNPSQTAISCSGNTFIGAVVKDSKGQVPPDDTEVTFIATSGQFTAASSSGTGSSTQTTTRPSATVTPTSGSGTSSSSTTTTSGQFIAKTSKNGALNVIYNAGPESNGQVSITAAAGAAFGTTTITVNCPTAIAAGSASAFGAGGAFRPPSTGEGLIKPPNTGDAGLVLE